MRNEMDWNDYLEPEQDGPETNREYSCPKCSHKELIPDSGIQSSPEVVCPICKIKMHEGFEEVSN